MTGELEQALALAVGAIDAVGLRYAIVGGLAVVAWTKPRATRDANLWVDLSHGRRLDLEYVRGWARKLDASIGADEVSERLSEAIAAASKRL